MTQSVLTSKKIMLGASAANKKEAIQLAGKLLVDAGHVSEEYIEKMMEREESLTTFIGNGVAIPHGTNDSKKFIRSTGISVVQIPGGVDFGNGNTAFLIVGIAALGDEHLDMLSNIAVVCAEEENVKEIIEAKTGQTIMDIFERGE